MHESAETEIRSILFYILDYLHLLQLTARKEKTHPVGCGNGKSRHCPVCHLCAVDRWFCHRQETHTIRKYVKRLQL